MNSFVGFCSVEVDLPSPKSQNHWSIVPDPSVDWSVKLTVRGLNPIKGSAENSAIGGQKGGTSVLHSASMITPSLLFEVRSNVSVPVPSLKVQKLTSPDSFHDYVGKLQVTARRFAESVTACVMLPPQSRLRRAEALNRKYYKLITLLASDTLVDPVEIGTLLAEHEAELVVARLALAVSASKKDGRFAGSLRDIESRFGGDVPVSPYSREPVSYRKLEDGRHFELTIPRLGALPEVNFRSLTPVAAQ